jgi:hypothetical protein
VDSVLKIQKENLAINVHSYKDFDRLAQSLVVQVYANSTLYTLNDNSTEIEAILKNANFNLRENIWGATWTIASIIIIICSFALLLKYENPFDKELKEKSSKLIQNISVIPFINENYKSIPFPNATSNLEKCDIKFSNDLAENEYTFLEKELRISATFNTQTPMIFSFNEHLVLNIDKDFFWLSTNSARKRLEKIDEKTVKLLLEKND